MNKKLALLTALMLFFGLTISSQAALITFDEIVYGENSSTALVNIGDIISDQYADLGITFSGSPAPEIIDGAAELGVASNVLRFKTITIDLDFSASQLIFDYRRPSATREMTITLSSSDGDYTTTVTGTDFWQFYSYTGSFDSITFTSSKYFYIDHIWITEDPGANTVPVPGSLILLLSGLLPVAIRGRKKR